MDGYDVVLNVFGKPRLKTFIPKINVSFQNGWAERPWRKTYDLEGNEYGRFGHLWRLIFEDANWLKKYSEDAPAMDYWKAIHVWFLELGMHVYIG